MVEIGHEFLNLLGVGEVVAAREERADLKLVLVEVALEVLAQPGFGCDFSVRRVVVIELPSFEILAGAFEVGDVEANVAKLVWL